MSFAYLPLYTGDYRRDTAHLTPQKHGIYLLLLMHCWDLKGPVPLDEQEAAGICNCRSADEIESLRYILLKYFIKLDDGWYNRRMQQEVERCEILSKSRSVYGLKGYQAKAKHLLVDNQANAKQVPLSPSPSPYQPNTSPEKDTQPSVESVSTDVATADPMPCPFLKLERIWHEILPTHPKLADWSTTRKAHARARWRHAWVEGGWENEAQGLEWFSALFRYVGSSKFLSGKVSNKDREPFICTLDWLIKPENFLKVIERKYS